jgi:mannose-6-phosphate isomerase-like protein (cupin superfamily)
MAKLFRKEDLLSAKIGPSDQAYRENILTDGDTACALGGLFVIIPPGVEGQFHYHVKRESVQIFLSGKAIGCFGDMEFPVGAGDVLFIPAREKHRISNRSDGEVRFLEFFTEPPVESDIVPVE